MKDSFSLHAIETAGYSACFSMESDTLLLRGPDEAFCLKFDLKVHRISLVGTLASRNGEAPMSATMLSFVKAINLWIAVRLAIFETLVSCLGERPKVIENLPPKMQCLLAKAQVTVFLALDKAGFIVWR